MVSGGSATVQVLEAGVVSVFPVGTLARTRKVWVPAASPCENEQEHGVEQEENHRHHGGMAQASREGESGDDHSGSGGDEGDANPPEAGDGDDGQPGHDGEHEANCSAADLTPGTPVHEASTDLTSTGLVFEEVELVK